ncbi:MAG: hypothetical protein WC455_24615 [Dehalococcoidia bacterium]|jgi:hypothetical protein
MTNEDKKGTGKMIVKNGVIQSLTLDIYRRSCVTNDKLFWEKFGFKESPTIVNGYSFEGWIYPDTSHHSGELPEMTLDNLFKYCEEKTLKIRNENLWERYRILQGTKEARKELFDSWLSFIDSGLPHAQALKKAIEEIVNA